MMIVSDVAKFSQIIDFLNQAGGQQLIITNQSKKPIEAIHKAILPAMDKKLKDKLLPQIANFAASQSWKRAGQILIEAYQQ